MKTDVRQFFKNFGIEVNNLDIFQEALTHNSFANEKAIKKSYENLEFLGDAVIQLKSSMYLYKKEHGFNKQGELTKKRKAIVCEETLARVAKEHNLGYLIRLGDGEASSNGREKKKILADVFEAITAAIYLDQGDLATDNWLNTVLFNDKVEKIAIAENYDYKTEFQEAVQSDKLTKVVYEEINDKRNEDNSHLFTVEVRIGDIKYGIGQGKSKKAAEQQAAKNALEKYKKND